MDEGFYIMGLQDPEETGVGKDISETLNSFREKRRVEAVQYEEGDRRRTQKGRSSWDNQ